MNEVITLSGKPGAGKGTRLERFLRGRENKYVVLSAGNILRKEVTEGTQLGIQAKSYMDAGLLVPDELIINMILERIRNVEDGKTIILDAFPRTVKQAKAALESGINITKDIDIFVPDEVVLERARNRIVCVECGETYTLNDYKKPKHKGFCDKCGGELHRRSDDAPEVVKKRLETYRDQTFPVVELLEKMGVDIWHIYADEASDLSIQFEFERAMLSESR